MERSGRGSDEIDFEIEKLNGIYDQRNRRMISGNLVGEIFKLNDFKKPSTRLGERYAEEMKRKVQLERPVEKTLLRPVLTPNINFGRGKPQGKCFRCFPNTSPLFK